jgi:DNA-binding response OmpR family regulator
MNNRIIIIEDDQALRESLTDFLTLNGHNVTAVGTGKDYLEVLSHTPFSVAIIDIGLPDCSGFDLAEETRKRFATKIILLTALSSIDDRVRGYQSGGHLYLTKPVDNRELSAAIFSLSRPADDKTPASPSEQADTTWILDLKEWQLIAPGKINVSLTNKEMQFLRSAVNEDQKTIERNEIIQALYPRVDAYTSRALDVMIRRLRRKVLQKSGRELPLKTLYSEGFQFTEPLCVKK